ANVFGAITDLTIVKLTNNTNNDAAPGLFLPVGSAATFTYTVTNTGNVALALSATINGVVVPNAIADDAGTPLDPTDDFASPAVVGAGGVIVGDDGDGVFEPGETWQFAAPAPRTVTAGQYTNTGTV